MCMWKWFSILICSSVQHGVIPSPNEFNGTWSYLACKTAFSDRISPWFSEVLHTCVYVVLFWWLNLSVTVIPYHITVTTGTEYDSSTDSRVYIIIMGQKVKTERLWLDLPEGKDEFADGSVEKFSVWGLDVGEIKKVEVLCELQCEHGGHMKRKAKETTCSCHSWWQKDTWVWNECKWGCANEISHAPKPERSTLHVWQN